MITIDTYVFHCLQNSKSAWVNLQFDTSLAKHISGVMKYDLNYVSTTYFTKVYVSFYLLSINELDEVAETLKTTGYLEVEWQDDFLSWNATDYGGLSYYHFPQDDVWKPDVALKNSVEKYKPLGVSTLNVQVDSDGCVFWYPFEVTYCSF